MLRSLPDPDPRNIEIPPAVLTEIRELFGKCFVTTTFGGTGYGHTSHKEVAERLQKGWVIGDFTNGAGQTAPVSVSCPSSRVGTFKKSSDKDAPTFYDFNIPSTLVPLVREINDAKGGP